ncbi:hypothetical protein [Spirillospora albida]|uniref:hypothetical protein n=1 Tax=Spirillospora albida TaxID=58123 RepID=UPI0012F9664F|nr:hypothetical protein [Spirillospora albida]
MRVPTLSGACQNLWDPTEAAKVMVPLTGVLAGFMFSAIVVLITVNRPTGTGRTEAFFALRLQVIALMTAVVAASSNINIAGEKVCLRARTEWVLSAGMLWTAVTLMSISLIWLLVAYYWTSPEVLRLLIGAAYFVLFGRLVGALLSANSYVSDLLPGSHVAFHAATWIATVLAVCPTLMLASRTQRPHAWETRITACSRAAITYLVLSFVGFDLVAATEATHWSTPTKPLVYLCGVLTLLPALLLFPFIFRSIPHPTAQNETAGSDLHDSGHRQCRTESPGRLRER